MGRFVSNSKRMKDKDLKKELKTRVFEAVETSLRLSNGNVILSIVKDKSFEFPPIYCRFW